MSVENPFVKIPDFTPWLIAVALFGCAIVPLGFAFIPMLAGIAVAGFLYVSGRERLRHDWPLLFWLLAIPALCTASALWSIVPEDSAQRGLKLLGMGVAIYMAWIGFRAISEQSAASARRIVPWIAIFQGVFCAIELYLDFPITRMIGAAPDPAALSLHMLNKHGAAFAMIAAAGLWFAWAEQQRLEIALIAIVVAIVLFKTASQATQLAFAVMAFSFAAVHFFPRKAVVASGGIIVFFMLSLPFAAPVLFERLALKLAEEGSLMRQASASMRLENYDFLSKKILERPVTGYGVDSTRAMTFETAQIYYKSDKIMHPHNFVLQIWMEFGFLGVSFFSAFIFFILRRIYQSQSAHRNLLFAIFCMAVTFLFVSWSMWASWLLGMIFFMTGITAKGGSEKGQAYVKAY